MRPRLENNIKRNCQIGIKVQKETREKLEFIAEREAHTLSTQIDIILKNYINEYFKKHKLDWSDFCPERREGSK